MAHISYRLVFNYIEPLFAIGGVLQILLNPKAYLDIAMPNLASQLDRPTSISSSALQTLYTQILGGWLIIIFNDLVTLRLFKHDANVWKCVLAAHLLSDIAYCYATWQDWGERVWQFNTWNGLDWMTVLTTIPALLLKVTFLLGIGVQSPQQPASRDSAKKKI